MKKIGQLGFFLLFFLIYACGVKGPLQPPLILIPQKIEAISFYQQEAKIILKWITPLVYEGGVAMSTWPVVEIWGLESPLSPDLKEKLDSFLKERQRKRKLLAEIKFEENQAGLSLPASLEASWEYSFGPEKIGQTAFCFELRIRDERGRKSAFSEPIVIVPTNPPLPPRGLKAELQESGVVLRWEASFETSKSEEAPVSEGYNIYRRESSSNWKRLNLELWPDKEFEDREVIIGKTYYYLIRAVRIVDSIERESEASEQLAIEMKDIFAPPPPAAVMAMAGEDRIIITWEPSAASDIAGYLIRRRAEGETTYELLTPEPIMATSYEDLKVEKGKSYHYAITACDQAGNESRPVEIRASVIKDNSP